MMTDEVKREIISSVRNWCATAGTCIANDMEVTATALANQAYGALTVARLCGLDRETSAVLQREILYVSERIMAAA